MVHLAWTRYLICPVPDKCNFVPMLKRRKCQINRQLQSIHHDNVGGGYVLGWGEGTVLALLCNVPDKSNLGRAHLGSGFEVHSIPTRKAWLWAWLPGGWSTGARSQLLFSLFIQSRTLAMRWWPNGQEWVLSLSSTSLETHPEIYLIPNPVKQMRKIRQLREPNSPLVNLISNLVARLWFDYIKNMIWC